MGQSISKVFKINGSSSSLDCSKLSKPSIGASRTVSTETFNELSSKSSLSSQDSQQHQQQQSLPNEPSLEDAVASARAFFEPWHTCQQGAEPIPPGPSRQGLSMKRKPQFQTSSLDLLGPERPPTRPVKCPSSPRVELFQEPEQLVSWNEEDDVEHLTRLYDQRTWQMFVLITEARKYQKRVDGAFREERHIRQEEGKCQQFSEEELLAHRGFATTAEVSLDQDMIFSIDLE